ncbi:MAG: TetR/AcrR family transcriptional regulator [Phycisphaerales bacterium]
MLDAAEVVVLRDGIGCLTLDAVAREAHLSKGGLLHHFPSKEALVDALVHRTVNAWRSECEAAIAAQRPGPGRIPRAFLNACLSSPDQWTDAVRRRGVVLVAALVHDAARVEPLRALHRELTARIAADGLPPGVGEAVQLAVDGLWFDWIFGLTELSPHRLAAVRAALGGLVRSAKPAASTARRRSKAVRIPSRKGVAARS